MKFYKICFFLISLFFLSARASVSNFKYDGDCNYEGSAESLKECLDIEVKKYNDKLTVLHLQLFKKGRHQSLKQAEILWDKFKESDCQSKADVVKVGFYHEVIKESCQVDKIKYRIIELEKRISFFSNPYCQTDADYCN